MNDVRLLDHSAFQPLPNRFIPLPTDEECAWLGGFVDGEGTVALSIHARTGTVKVAFSVANTNLDNVGRARVLLRALIDHDVMPKLGKSPSRPDFSLKITRHSDVRVVLQAIRPWLVGKRPQADLMLEYLAECSSAAKVRGRGRRDTPELRARRHVFVRRMKELNRRYRPGEWTELHPNERIDPAAIDSTWKAGQRAEFLGDSWESIKALLRLRCGY